MVLSAHLPGGVPAEFEGARDARESRFQARAVIAGKDAKALAAEFLAMSEDELRAAFRGSAMKREKQAGLVRNSAGVLGNTGDSTDSTRLPGAPSLGWCARPGGREQRKPPTA